MLYLFGGLGVVILLLGLAVGFEHTRVVAANNRATAAELRLKDAQDRATALALLWSAQVDKTEAEKRKADDERKATFDALDARVRGVSGKCVAPRDVAGLLADIARAANAAGIAAVDQSAGDAVSRSPQAARAKR